MADQLTDAAADDYCYLTTTGRVSGDPHEIEIWFALGPPSGPGSTLYLLSGAGDRSDWVRNAVARPEVTVRVREISYSAIARVVERGTDEDDRARTLVFEKYQPRYSGELDDWRVRSLVVALDVAHAD